MTDTSAAPVPRRWPLRYKLLVLLASSLVGALLLAGYLVLEGQSDRDRTLGEEDLDPYSLTLVDQHGRPVTERRGNLRMMLDPFAVYRNQPDQRTGVFTVDARGNRVTPSRPAAPKLALLGASSLFGFKLPSDRATFAWLLAERFPDLEVVNAGVPGYLSAEELSTMVHRFEPNEAVAYVVFDGWNELLDQLYYQRRYDFELGFTNQFFFVEERLHRLVAEAAEIEPVAAPEPPPEDETYFDRLIAVYHANLVRMQAVARGRGADFLVALQPELGAKRARTEGEQAALALADELYEYQTFPERYAELRARTRAFCDRESIPVLDLAEHPSLRDAEAELYYDAVHLNEEGHRRVASILAKRLEELLER